MKTGIRGTFVISWSQIEVDGVAAPPPAVLTVGAAWSWHGNPTRMDGPTDVLQLDQADGAAQLRRRAGRVARRLFGCSPGRPDTRVRDDDADQPPCGGDTGCLILTDGIESYTGILVAPIVGKLPLLMFRNELPPSRRDLWVVRHDPLPRGPVSADAGDGLICFTNGTRIDTPTGAVPVEHLRQGDKVLTVDNGPQPLCWIGRKHVSGARLCAMPDLRPVRIAAGALRGGWPAADLLVSPQHRVVLTGRRAQALFNTDEVLVTARDLVDDHGIRVDHSLRAVTYSHLMFERHQIIRANGIETESFHPASADLAKLDADDRRRLLSLRPELKSDPLRYGVPARRALTAPETAILRHAA